MARFTATNGSTLEYSLTGVEWTMIHNIESMPAITSTPEQISTTNLSSVRQTSIAGLADTDTLEFTVMRDLEDFISVSTAIDGVSEMNYRIVYPDGVTVPFRGEATIGLGEAGVNGVNQYVISITCSDGPHIELPTGVVLD